MNSYLQHWCIYHLFPASCEREILKSFIQSGGITICSMAFVHQKYLPTPLSHCLISTVNHLHLSLSSSDPSTVLSFSITHLFITFVDNSYLIPFLKTPQLLSRPSSHLLVAWDARLFIPICPTSLSFHIQTISPPLPILNSFLPHVLFSSLIHVIISLLFLDSCPFIYPLLTPFSYTFFYYTFYSVS